jgi:hypothetical protein
MLMAVIRLTDDGNGNIMIDNDKLVARIIIHPGENADGYWNNENLSEQLNKQAIPIFKILHPDQVGVFHFDNSSNHQTYAPDALLTRNLIKGDGGAKAGRAKMPMRSTKYIDSNGNEVVQLMQKWSAKRIVNYLI